MNSSRKDGKGSEALPTSITDIIITSQLGLRPPRNSDLGEEAAAFWRISETLKRDPANIFDICVEVGLSLCKAQSCGISIREETDNGEDVFRWISVAGSLLHLRNATMPRFFSPCGVCVDEEAPILMQEPERFYTYFKVGTPIHEVLLVPLKGSHLEATIWIVAHDETRKFDKEDARVMQHIAVFVATALHLVDLAKDATAEAAQKDVAFRELQHRVQNTLAMTASLLRYQLNQTSEPGARSIIEAASGQVLAISRAHKYADCDGEVDLMAVITDIANALLNADPRFDFTLEGESAIIPAQKASVAALIANELITNAMKHGLAGRERGSIALRLGTLDGSYILSVSDDGRPLPTANDDLQSGSGLNLLRLLAEQLGGELTVEANPKRFSVRFSIDPQLKNIRSAPASAPQSVYTRSA